MLRNTRGENQNSQSRGYYDRPCAHMANNNIDLMLQLFARPCMEQLGSRDRPTIQSDVAENIINAAFSVKQNNSIPRLLKQNCFFVIHDVIKLLHSHCGMIFKLPCKHLGTFLDKHVLPPSKARCHEPCSVQMFGQAATNGPCTCSPVSCHF